VPDAQQILSLKKTRSGEQKFVFNRRLANYEISEAEAKNINI
jgi:hypothetical protein